MRIFLQRVLKPFCYSRKASCREIETNFILRNDLEKKLFVNSSISYKLVHWKEHSFNLQSYRCAFLVEQLWR